MRLCDNSGLNRQQVHGLLMHKRMKYPFQEYEAQTKETIRAANLNWTDIYVKKRQHIALSRLKYGPSEYSYLDNHSARCYH